MTLALTPRPNHNPKVRSLQGLCGSKSLRECDLVPEVKLQQEGVVPYYGDTVVTLTLSPTPTLTLTQVSVRVRVRAEGSVRVRVMIGVRIRACLQRCRR